MKQVKHIILFLIPLILIFGLTIMITIHFDKLMSHDIGKISKYEISDNESIAVFEDRIANINNCINNGTSAIYMQKYSDIINSIRASQTGKYSDQTYQKIIDFALEHQWIKKELEDVRRGRLKVAQYNNVNMLDIYIMENLDTIQFTYTIDENNIYFLFQNYRSNREEVAIKQEEISNTVIEESKSFLKSTKIESLAEFHPTKLWFSEIDGLYMLEDSKNDIIVCYDLIEKKPVGFVKGFST